jgi:hypothetical protein
MEATVLTLRRWYVDLVHSLQKICGPQPDVDDHTFVIYSQCWPRYACIVVAEHDRSPADACIDSIKKL